MTKKVYSRKGGNAKWIIAALVAVVAILAVCHSSWSLSIVTSWITVEVIAE